MKTISLINNFSEKANVKEGIIDNKNMKSIEIFWTLLFKYSESQEISIIIGEENESYYYQTINKEHIQNDFENTALNSFKIPKTDIEDDKTYCIYNVPNINLNRFSNYICLNTYENTIYSNVFTDYYFNQFINAYNHLSSKENLNYFEPILDNHEIIELYKNLNNTDKEFKNKTKTIINKIELNAKLYPDLKALSLEGEYLSFGELNEKADALSAYIIKKVDIETKFIPICVERSFEMYIGILAILKAKKAYVPIDPSLPKKTIKYILNDINCSFALTTEKFKYLFEDVQLIYLDKEYAKKEIIEIMENNQEDSIMYVIYTSGTTGNPKGVILKNSAVANRLDWMIEEYNFSSEDIFIQKTPFNFDVSVWEIFIPLMIGSLTIIAKPQGHKDTSYLKNVINKNKVSIIHFVPSMLTAFLEDDVKSCTSLKKVFCSGEALKNKQVITFFDTFNAELHNLYGPTEAAIDVTYFECNPINLTTVPIGKPISNMKFVIIKDNMLQPIGHIGELYVGGIGLAEGYLNKSVETENSFIKNQFLVPNFKRLYKTGDLVRLNQEGLIEYLGRNDKQIKVRGNRIELQVIEDNILRIENIKDVFVKGIEKEYGTSLVAFILSDIHKDDWDISTLKRFLSEQLTDYMIPNEFVFLKEWTLSHNGKIDKKEIIKNYEKEIKHKKFNTYENTELIDIIREVLSDDDINDYDNFYAVGGDSITALIVSSKAKKMGIPITIQNILESKKISDIKSSDLSNQNKIVYPYINKLSPIQKWFFNKDIKNPNHWNMSLLLKVNKSIDIDNLKISIKNVLMQQEVFRTLFYKTKNDYFQNIIDKVDIKISEYTIDDSNKDDFDDLIRHLQTELDIEKQLYKVSIIEHDSDRYVFFAMHHLIIDGVSWRILISDIEDYYLNQRDTNENEIPTTTYNNWTYVQHELAEGNSLSPDIYYWNNIFERSTEKHRKSKGKIKCKVVYLDKYYTNKLISKCLSKGYEINEILISPLSQVFKYMGKSNIYLSLEGHGRENIQEFNDFSHIIGWFTSIFPININFNNDDNPIAVLNKVKKHLNSIPYKGMTFGILNNLSNKLNYIEKPNIKFNYLGQFNDTKLFQFVDYKNIHDVSEDEITEYPIDMTLRIINNQLEVRIEFDDNFSFQTIDVLSAIYLETLTELINQITNLETEKLITKDDLNILSKYGYTLEDYDE